jgi:hypothetical protein
MQYRVYNELNPSGTTILHGLKGQTFLEEPGYVFAPYVPLQVTSLISQAHRNAKLAGLKVVRRKGMITKYGKKAVQPDFYSTILVKEQDED